MIPDTDLPVQQHHVFRIPADVLFQEVGGEAVLLNLGNERYFGLDAIGTRIWHLIQAGTPVAGIVARIGDEFEAAPEQISRDLDALLAELQEAGLIVPG